MTIIEDRYREGRFVRRWSLIGGFPVCLEDAVDTTTAHPVAVTAAEAENARIRQAIEAVEAYEASLTGDAVPEEPPSVEVLALHHRRIGADLSEGQQRPNPVRVALVQEGAVLDVRWVDADWEAPAGVAVKPFADGAAPGGTWSQAEGFVPPSPPPPPVPSQIERRQLILGLALDGLITWDQVEAFGTVCTIPPLIETAFAGLPTQQRNIARASLREMNFAERSSPLVGLVAQAAGKTSAEMDDAFRRWSAL